MQSCGLSETLLLDLGILDEVYDLYTDLCIEYENAYEGFFDGQESSKITLWPDDLDELARKGCRRLLDEFLLRNGYLFSEKYPRMRTSAKSMRMFSMLTISISHLTISYRISSFSVFLKDLYRLIVRIILIKIQFQKPKTPYEVVEARTQKRLSEMVEHLSDEVERARQAKIHISNTDEVLCFRNLSAISCNQKNHSVIPKLCTVKTLFDSCVVVILAHCCETCGRIFIGDRTLKLYEKRFGKLAIRTIADTPVTETSQHDFTSLHRESLLHQLGYNVVAGAMTDRQRQKLLKALIDNQMISYFQAVRDLENAIRIFSSVESHQAAVRKWTDDLAFLTGYVKNQISESQTNNISKASQGEEHGGV